MIRRFGRPLSLILLAGCSGGQEASGAQGGGGRGGNDGQRVIPVAAAPAERRDVARAVTVVGPVEPIRTIGVNSLMAGTVLQLHAQEGDRVRAGQVLAELDARETRAQLERARAVLANAQAVFERNQQLHANRIITDAEFDQSRAAFDVAKSDAELWGTRFAFSRITAPSAGIVTAKHVEAGSAVSPNQRVFDLADVRALVVRVRLSELDVVHLRAGAKVAVSLDAYPAARLEGEIRRVFPAADAESRLVPVEVMLGASPAGVTVRPGYLARVMFALDRRSAVLAVPAPAVGVGDDGAFVYVVEADSVAPRAVTLGLNAEGWVEIVAGLREGERVVTSGHINLRPGSRVRVTAAGGGAG
ncbi:MAG: efflux RND transporter periplasmic adaptor subunit, partial [Gemmatimonadales bacterium]|nr:efflux RND transporter periplasmic adaptor subunit [Gemmatimonadales bacterium]